MQRWIQAIGKQCWVPLLQRPPDHHLIFVPLTIVEKPQNLFGVLLQFKIGVDIIFGLDSVGG